MMFGCSGVTMRGLRTVRGLVSHLRSVERGHRTLVTCSSTLDSKRWHSSPPGGEGGGGSTSEPEATKPQLKAPRLKRRTRPLSVKDKELEKIIGTPLQKPAGHLYGGGVVDDEGDTEMLVGDGTKVKPAKSTFFIPQIALHEEDGREKKRVLV